MKTIEQLLSQEQVFLDLFSGGKESIAYEFNISLTELEGKHFLVADYSYENYSGEAYCLFIEDGKIYEVSAGHCSCYGLEGQFEPEHVPIEVLYHRLENKLYNSHYLTNIL